MGADLTEEKIGEIANKIADSLDLDEGTLNTINALINVAAMLAVEIGAPEGAFTEGCRNAYKTMSEAENDG